MSLLISLLIAAASEPIDLVFRGVCDGSTAIATPSGRVLLAYDEDRSLYLFGSDGGAPLGQHDLSEALGLPGSRELDLEGSVAIGAAAWWVGSHGNNRDGEHRPARHVLFSTTLPSRDDLSDLELTRAPVNLSSALKKSRDVGLDAEVLSRAPKRGGLNIEGLDAHPDGGLLLGLRSPLSAADGMTGEAAIARLVAKTKKSGVVYKVKGVDWLDLGDRGVRSLVRDGDRWLVLAGPVPKGGRFAIYSWDGVSAPVDLGISLAGLNPEALLPLGGGRWLVISDDGAVRRIDAESAEDDGLSECKDIRRHNPQGAAHPSVYARARVLRLE